MKKVLIYTQSTCPWCRKAKKFFKDRDIPFEYVDYDLAGEREQEQIMDEMHKTSGSASFPYVKINGNVVVGYNPKRYLRLMGL